MLITELHTERTTKEVENSNRAASEEPIKKKKKKRSEESDSNVAADQSEAPNGKIANPAKNSEELLENNTVSESKAKSKGKKKAKRVQTVLIKGNKFNHLR